MDKKPKMKDENGLLSQAGAKKKGFVINLNDPKVAGKKHWLAQKDPKK